MSLDQINLAIAIANTVSALGVIVTAIIAGMGVHLASKWRDQAREHADAQIAKEILVAAIKYITELRHLPNAMASITDHVQRDYDYGLRLTRAFFPQHAELYKRLSASRGEIANKQPNPYDADQKLKRLERELVEALSPHVQYK